MLFLFWSIKLDEKKTLTRTSIQRYSETLNLNPPLPHADVFPTYHFLEVKDWIVKRYQKTLYDCS